MRVGFLAGLFLTTLCTLALEILDTRLLSVVTWYHLSFFAVSVAMLGMASGAVHVYLAGDRWRGEGARERLPRACLWLGVAINSLLGSYYAQVTWRMNRKEVPTT